MPISLQQLVAKYPRLYHLAEIGAWDSIKNHGLLSTSALVDLFEVEEARKIQIISMHRPESVRIDHPDHGTAVIRDQKPMNEKKLLSCLDGIGPSEWYAHLNKRVFFWPTLDRLGSFRKAYPDGYDLIVLNSASFLEMYENEVRLSHINSGAVLYKPVRRGLELFKTLEAFPYELRRKYGRKAVAELTIERAVGDIALYVERVERWRHQEFEVTYSR